MEDGSGGFMTDLYFSGGNFGFVDSYYIHTDTSLTYFSAYFGNQQFTTRNLLFNGCKTAIQIFWDWGWTLQGIAVVSGTTGITVTGGVSSTPKYTCWCSYGFRRTPHTAAQVWAQCLSPIPHSPLSPLVSQHRS